MAFTIRPYRRFPVQCLVTYHAGPSHGHGTVWNLSRIGWRFSGNLPLRVGEVCSLTVTLPPYQLMYMAAAIVRWGRSEEYGVETIVMDDESRDELEDYLDQHLNSTMEPDG